MCRPVQGKLPFWQCAARRVVEKCIPLPGWDAAGIHGGPGGELWRYGNGQKAGGLSGSRRGIMCENESGWSGTVIAILHPGAGRDAGLFIRAAIEEAGQAKGPAVLLFEKGKVYEVWPETSYHVSGYYISNSADRTENPGGERWSALFLHNLKDIIVDGNGSAAHEGCGPG